MTWHSFRTDPPDAHVAVVGIRLECAYLCECGLICDSAMQCMCGNKQGLLSLASVLNRKPTPQDKEWSEEES